MRLMRFSLGAFKLKEIVHPKMKLLASFIHNQLLPNLFDYLFCGIQKGKQIVITCSFIAYNCVGRHFLNIMKCVNDRLFFCADSLSKKSGFYKYYFS